MVVLVKVEREVVCEEVRQVDDEDFTIGISSSLSVKSLSGILAPPGCGAHLLAASVAASLLDLDMAMKAMSRDLADN